MTPEERTAYWHKFNSFQQRMERKYAPQINKAIKEQIEIYIKTGDVNLVSAIPVYKVLQTLYKDAGVNWAHKAIMHLPKKKARLPMGFSERIVQLMLDYYGMDILNDSDRISQTTRDFISEVLSDAAEEGFGFDEIVKRLRNTELTQSRARMIARTETVTATNGAALIAAEDTGLAFNKIWISVRDNRTRHSHITEDDTVVDQSQPFIVGDGNTEMMQPGVRTQPNGLPVPLNEFINCRCTFAPIAKRDANGRLVMA